ncbi:MAG: glycosyltransferase [Acidobacteria bacterium]|nr:glycosyltransferase [Acidobacteriota bacterium]
MKIAQVVLPGASAYERKSQRIDLALLVPDHEVLVVTEPLEVRGSGADVAHIYGPPTLPAPQFQRFTTPYVANGAMPRRRFALRRPPEPAYVVTPVPETENDLLPEAVEETYFETPFPTPGHSTIGSFARPSVENIVEQTMARIDRFRNDVIWNVFETPPRAEQMAAIDVWVDPALGEDDFDGFTAEALVSGRVVVASRTIINLHRTEKGRTAFLVPPNDPNEATHAILAALFKPELSGSKVEGAKQTQSKFRPRQRLRVLAAIYGNLVRQEPRSQRS